MYASAIARAIGTCFPHEVLSHRDLLTTNVRLPSNMLQSISIVTLVQMTIHCKLREVVCKPTGHNLFVIK